VTSLLLIAKRLGMETACASEQQKIRGNRYTRNPSGKPPQITERDIAIFRIINVHGDLSAPYIHAYLELLFNAKDYQSTYKRLGKLYHYSWLDRHPGQYRDAKNTDRNYAVYRLSNKASKYLRKKGLYIEIVPRSCTSWKHDFLRSCFTFSVNFHCLKHPDEFEFIPHYVIVERIGKDELHIGDKRMKTDKAFIPDVLFGIKYKKAGGARIFMTEIDCDTEQGPSTEKSKKNHKVTIEGKILVYRQYYKEKKHIADFGREGIMVAFVTNYLSRMHYINELALKVKPHGYNYLIINDAPCFGDFLYPPKEVFDHFYAPWLLPGNSDFYLNVA